MKVRSYLPFFLVFFMFLVTLLSTLLTWGSFAPKSAIYAHPHLVSNSANINTAPANQSVDQIIDQQVNQGINQSVVTIDDRIQRYDLGTYLQFLKDSDKNLTIEDVSSPAFSQQFFPSKWNPPSFGYTNFTYWARLPIANTTDRDLEWILFLEHQLIDHIHLYVPDQTQNQSQKWNVIKTGLLHPFTTRDIPDRLFAFRIPLPAHSQQTIYLCLETSTSLIIDAHLSSPSVFWQHRSTTNFLIGISYGVVIFAVLYNLLLLFSLKDLGYLYYIIISLGTSSRFAMVDGLIIQYFWQYQVTWNNSIIFLGPLVAVFAILQWTSEFLQIRELFLPWHRYLRGFQVASILLLIGFLLFPFRAMVSLGAIFLLSTSCFTASLGILAYRRGYYPARYYLLSCFSLFLSIFLIQLAFLGVIPASVWIREFPRFGVIALMIFLSLALGDRINLIKSEKLQEQQIALQEKDELNSDLQLIQDQLLKRERKLEYDAYHDTLTGLPNRAWLMQRLQYLTQNRLAYGVLFIDLDQFKTINDTLGHPIGDKLLKYASFRIQAILDRHTNVARLGGDEFVILLEEIVSIEEAVKLADLIQIQLQLPFKLGDYELFISASIGINLGTGNYQKPEEILRDADLAMYQAKHKGRGRYEIFDPRVRRWAMERLNLEQELRQGIDRGEFCLYYQPIVCLQTQQIQGVEALLRWQHPSGKIISPEQFISIAEETGLINPLGWWIVESACQQMQQWQQQFSINNSTNSASNEFKFFMNVNISPIQLKQQDLVRNLRQILRKTSLPGHYLKLEITESCLLETTNSQLELLNQLQELGIKLCIDDFGTGYSSLNRLHTLPINTLKIDRSFVDRLTSGHTEIIEMIVALGHSLDMSIVAEGIEVVSQAEQLNKLGCQLGQGYLFSPPLTAEDLTYILQKSYFSINPSKVP
ncbi:MAG: EAL domain-containing protein [Coleofasciculaceae cyanobacterium SM2_1_6]|nr:EAL domain-containing protein [Coleofasciculaceae cyanobacterium SM2_1_6]